MLLLLPTLVHILSATDDFAFARLAVYSLCMICWLVLFEIPIIYLNFYLFIHCMIPFLTWLLCHLIFR